MTILLSDIWPIAEPQRFKLHFARWNKADQPLEVWLRDRQEWQTWHEYRPAHDAFNRPFIFTLIQFYHETDIWLFGGIYSVLDRLPDRYVVSLSDEGSAFLGRLKLRTAYRSRATRVNLENHYRDLEVSEILAEPYSGRAFPGFDTINLSFQELEALVRKDRPDWKAALSSVKGIYLITDTFSGRRYVGSAYGEQGIWSRWAAYVATGHGGNVELRSLVDDPNLEYCRKAFRFALLESRPALTSDDVIVARESFWKDVLGTRGEGGLNRN